ncbi:MAG TPA: hypothetical protein VF491_20570, partial [Vicinamibacterales bacterium]
LLALLAVPGVMFSGSQLFAYAHLRHQPAEVIDRTLLQRETFHIDFVMGVAGLITMMVWSSLTPDRRDAHVLGPLPIPARQQAVARLLALFTFFALFIAAMAVPTGVAHPFVTVGAENIMELPGRVLGHILGAVFAGAFVFFILVNVQLFLAAAFGPGAVRKATLPLQLVAMAGMVLALISSGSITNLLLANATTGGSGVLWNPAAWFVGVYRWVAGDARPVFAMLAARGALAGLGVIALTLVMYPLAYERCLRNVIAAEGRRTTAMSRGWASLAARLLRPLLPLPLQRGLAAFMLATLGRSHTHRFLIGLYAGLAFLLSLPLADRVLHLPTTGYYRYGWFVMPLGYVFWMVCGLRVSLMMPVEPVANWIFKITEPVDKRHVLTTVVTMMTTVTALPIAAVFAAALLVLGEQRLAVTVFIVVFLAGLCLIELLTLTMKTVPFSCTYLPGQLKLRIYWAPFFFLWLNFCFTLGNWSLWALQSWGNTARLAGFLVALWVALRVWHMIRARKIGRFVYDEQEPALVTTMEISTMMRQI